MVEIANGTLLIYCFDQLIELVVVVGYLKEMIIDYYGDEYEGVPITYAHQREDPADAAFLVEEVPIDVVKEYDRGDSARRVSDQCQIVENRKEMELRLLESLKAIMWCCKNHPVRKRTAGTAKPLLNSVNW